MGLVLNSLPAYSGPYAVSTHDVELAVEGAPDASFSRALLAATRAPALVHDTTLVTVFYPTALPTRERMPWLERPLATTARGYAKFLAKSPWLVTPLVYLFGRNLALATRGIDQPLLAPAAASWPVVVFSHGLSGNRTTYSQYCGELASQGHVVVAVEHRDGSGPVSIVKLDDADPAVEKTVDYIKESDLSYEDERDRVPFLEFRGCQLEMRKAEVSHVLAILAQINRGEATDDLERRNRRRNSYGKKTPFGWQDWKGKLDLGENLVMAGHSFGGATTIQILRSNSKFRFAKGLALDPWADPIPPAVIELAAAAPGQGCASSSTSTLISTSAANPDKGQDSEKPAVDPAHLESTSKSDNENVEGESRPTISVPFLVINSEAFTLWKPHFYLVRDIVRAVPSRCPSWFFTILGSVHVSFSDVPLFLPSYLSPKQATTPARTSHALIVETSLEFLRGEYATGRHLSGTVRDGDQEYVNPARGEGGKGPLKVEPGEGYARLHVKGTA